MAIHNEIRGERFFQRDDIVFDGVKVYIDCKFVDCKITLRSNDLDPKSPLFPPGTWGNRFELCRFRLQVEITTLDRWRELQGFLPTTCPVPKT